MKSGFGLVSYTIPYTSYELARYVPFTAREKLFFNIWYGGSCPPQDVSADDWGGLQLAALLITCYFIVSRTEYVYRTLKIYDHPRDGS
jgi:hypothetical protein